MSQTPTPGRRELNKARTRESIVEALRDLVAAEPITQITVDQLAERADVSRRTFFNYYAGIPAVLVQAFSDEAALMVERMDEDLLREDPVAAMRALVRGEGIPEGLLAWCAALNSHADRGADSVLIERAVWSDLAAWLEGVLTDRLPEGTDPLYVSTLASSVMSTFSAAEQTWLAALPSPRRLRPTDITAFHEQLDRALGYLATSWQTTS